MSFDAVVREIERNAWRVHGLEMYRDGALVRRWGDTQDRRYPIYSATKTVTALAVGMAQDDGRLSIDEPVLRYLPADAVRAMPQAQREAYAPVTLRRLMSMSVAGYPFRPEGAHWLDMALSVPLLHPEKRVFDYSNVPAYLAGVAAACAVDEPLDEYLDRRLFEPLGIIDPPCGHCPDGYFYGASQMELTVNELSRIGRLLAGGGVYGGQRLLSEDFVREATSVQQMNREGGYGLFLWKYRDGFSINGKWGQKCYVLPASRTIVTFLADMPNNAKDLQSCVARALFDDAQ